MKWKQVSPTLELVLDGRLMVAMSREEWGELERLARRDEFDSKHPRCGACGQFLRKRVVLEGSLLLGGERDRWVSHYVQDYWGEWDHV